MIRYRFLRTKRFPHPDGPKRSAGTVYPIDPETATAWLRSGIIEPLEAAGSEPVTESKPKRAARKRAPRKRA